MWFIAFVLLNSVFAAPVVGNFFFDKQTPSGSETISPIALIEVEVTGVNLINHFNQFVFYIDSANVLVTTNPNYSYSTGAGLFRYQVTNALSSGLHVFGIEATDDGGTCTRVNFAAFVASQELNLVDKPIVWPSPATSNVLISYELTGSQDVDIFIYDMNGRMVYRKMLSAGEEGARSGLNLFPYNLKMFDGRELSNGVYVLAIIKRKSDSNTVLGKSKFLVLR